MQNSKIANYGCMEFVMKSYKYIINNYMYDYAVIIW